MTLTPPKGRGFQCSNKNIKYLLIVGYAVGYHGYPRATNDMNIFISRDNETANQLISALKIFGFDIPQLEKNFS